MGLRVPERDYKCMKAEVLALEVEIGPDDSIVGEIGDSTDPKLHSVFGGGM